MMTVDVSAFFSTLFRRAGVNQWMSRTFQVMIFLLIGITIAAPTQMWGQNSICLIKGTVTDRLGHPIEGAAILVEQTGQSVYSDKKGMYCIHDLEGGAYHLLVSAESYLNEHSRPVYIQSDSTFTVNFVLTPMFRSDLVVTGTRTEKRLEEVPVRTEVIKRDEIEASSSRTLADAVEFTTGIRVESNCQNCNFSQVRLLGLDGAYTQILVDSMPIVSSLAQVYGIEQIPARLIDRIEVVKGGGSAIYGAGSVGGVINIIPHEPVRSGGSVETRVEWMDGQPGTMVNAMVDWVSPDNDVTFTSYGQVDSVEPLDLTGDAITEVSRRDLETFGFRLNRYLFEGNVKFTLDYSRLHEDRRGGDRLDDPEFMANIAESVQSQRDTSSVTWLHTVTPSFDYRISTAVALTERDSYYGSGMDPNAYGKTENPMYLFDSQFNHNLADHTLSWGLQYSSDSLKDEQPAYDRFTDETYTDLGIFIQDDWDFSKDWELIYGVRVDDHSEVDESIMSFRSALMWSPVATIQLRTSVATGFRAPQVFDEDLHITQVGGEGQIIRNAPDLEEESSTNIMAGIEWMPRVGRGYGLVEVNGFYTDLKDLFHVEEADDASTEEFEFLRVNFGKAGVYGVEVNLGYTFGNYLTLQAGYVEQRSRFEHPEPDFDSRDFFRTPEHYGVLTILWRDPELVNLFVGVKYTGSMKAPHYAGYIDEDRLETTDSLLTLDVNLSKEFPFGREPTSSIEITLGGKNLTNEYQGDLDQGIHRDSGYIYGPRFPRSYHLGVRINF